ncbi:MAG: GntG family PLP-dependent aldolase [Pirellulaceae bacterium]
MIDLRSDTVTRPTAAMRQAMAHADVGDDVIDIDPTVRRLEERTAEVLGTEAAIFMPSGSMTNQVGIRVHCGRGDEFICEANCHVYTYEQGAYAQLSGIATRTVEGESGVMRLDQLRDLIRPENDHSVRTRLIALENTHNRGGGRILPFDEVQSICAWAHANGLRRHLDGARLWNAAVASGVDEASWSAHFDSISVCFSKGLGAPVGSCLAGGRDFIREARRGRKLFGGGMRQAGIIAAGALYALEHHRSRLADDHEHAQLLARTIDETPNIRLQAAPVDTNIVVFEVDPQWGTPKQFVQELADLGLAVMPFGPRGIRMVTHLDVNRQQIGKACDMLRVVARLNSVSVAT